MTKETKSDSLKGDKMSNRLGGLSEDRRKLLEAIMDKADSEQQTHSSSSTSGATSDTNDNPFRNKGSNPSPETSNPFGKEGTKDSPGMGEDSFYDAGKKFFQNMGSGNKKWQEMAQQFMPGMMGANPFDMSGKTNCSEQPSDCPPKQSVSPLVFMKSTGTRPPFFCVHAMLGSVFPFHKLAALMEKDQPFYGIQSTSMDKSKPSSKSIEEMATEYICAIKEIQGKGPYYISGYSFGGWIAYEMAKQLLDSGEKINLLAMFGTIAPGLPNPFMKKMQYGLQYMKDLKAFVFNSATANNMGPGNAFFDNMMKNTFIPPLFRTLGIHAKAQMSYTAQPVPVQIDLFLTQDLRDFFTFDLNLGWSRLCAIEQHNVSGNHINTFHEPHVKDLAEKLTHCLKNAQTNHV